MEFPVLQAVGDRRAGARRRTRVPVVLETAVAEFDAVAVDFSSSGIRLEFADQQPPAALAESVGFEVRVRPRLDGETSAQAVGLGPLAARVVHASDSCVGVAIRALPDAWRACLEAAPSVIAAPRRQPAAVAADTAPGNAEFAGLRSRCRAIFAAFLRDFGSEALSMTTDRLGALEGEASVYSMRNEYLTARTVLSTQTAPILDHFCAMALLRFDQNQAVSDDANAAAPADLRLMHADELEDYLAISAVIKQCHEALAAKLDSAELRFSRLTGQPVVRGKSPFAPEATLRELRAAVTIAKLPAAGGRSLCQVLSMITRQRVETLLDDIVRTLTAVPQATRPVSTHGVRGRAASGHRRVPLSALATADPGARQLVSGMRGKLDTNAASPATRPLGVIDSLSRAAHRVNTGRSRFGPALVAAEPQPPAGTPASVAELMGAIGDLPSSTGAAFSETTIDAVQDALKARAAQSGTVQPIVSAAHAEVLATCTRLFQRASHDFGANGDIEILVKRLEQTLLKLALRDGEFPSSPQHPARKVLNLIDQYNFAAGDDGKLLDGKLKRNLDALVSRICDQADSDAGIFAVAQQSIEQDVDSLRRDRRERVDRIVEALESRDRVRVARAAVDRVFARRLSERKLPRLMIRLLDEVCRQHCILTALRYGDASQAWADALQLVEQTLTVAAAGLDDPATLALRKALYREISTVLREVVSDRPLRDRFSGQLEALLIDGDPAVIADAVVAPKFVPPDTSLTANDASRFAMQLGDWWDMQVGQQRLPVQLVWCSRDTGHLGFVNRAATNKLEMTAEEFGRRMRSNHLRARESLDVPLLDRSEASLLNDAYADTLGRSERDPVTNLLTRRGFLRRLAEVNQPGSGGSHHAVVLIEFDQLRAVGASAGLDALDELTKTLADTVKASAGNDSCVGIYRDDVFSVLLPHHAASAANRVAQNLCRKLTDFTFPYREHVFRIGVAVGVLDFDAGQLSTDEVLRRADAACLAAGAGGRNRVQRYEPGNEDLRTEELRLQWVGRVESLLDSDALYLRAQMLMPISAAAGELPSYEILLGIDAPGEKISPYEFVAALQRLGRSHELDLWVLRHTFAWLRENWAVLDAIESLSVNLSVASLTHPAVISMLRQALADASLPARKLVFEITESAAIQSFEAAERFIVEMRRFGVGFSLDDFGSGFTSYAHLKRLSVDKLKIDGSYVVDMCGNASDLAIVKSMTDIAHTLGMQVIAEWVESPQILEKLIEVGVDYAQGYAVHKPVRLSELVAPPDVTGDQSPAVS